MLQLNPISSHEVENLIQSLKSKDSHGYGEIPTRILKISASYIVSPLTFIFSRVLRTGLFHERVKLSVIKPLLKKASPSELVNYRPISMLTAFLKGLEKIIYKRFYSYLIKYNLLSEEQSGFKEKLSTCSAANALINSILISFEKNKFVGGLFCDMNKALIVLIMSYCWPK